MSGGPTFFQGDGAQLLFSKELIVFQGVPDSCTPSGFAHCLCARVYVCGLLKSPKNEARSKFFKGIDDKGNLKKLSPKLYFIYYVRSGKYLS